MLFYTEYNTKDFVETVHYTDPHVAFKNVESFGKYYIEDIQELENDGKNVYVIKKEDKDKFNLEAYEITEFEKYIVIQ